MRTSLYLLLSAVDMVLDAWLRGADAGYGQRARPVFPSLTRPAPSRGQPTLTACRRPAVPSPVAGAAEVAAPPYCSWPWTGTDTHQSSDSTARLFPTTRLARGDCSWLSLPTPQGQLEPPMEGELLGGLNPEDEVGTSATTPPSSPPTRKASKRTQDKSPAEKHDTPKRVRGKPKGHASRSLQASLAPWSQRQHPHGIAETYWRPPLSGSGHCWIYSAASALCALGRLGLVKAGGDPKGCLGDALLALDGRRARTPLAAQDTHSTAMLPACGELVLGVRTALPRRWPAAPDHRRERAGGVRQRGAP